MAWTAVNPATGETLSEHPELNDSEVEEIVRSAHRAFQDWRRTSFEERASVLRTAAGILEDRAEELGQLITREMGKPLEQAVAEVRKCAVGCEYYAEHAAAHLAPEPVELPDSDAKTFIEFEPLGVILAIMPWNFPFWQAFRFSAPGLMAGNAVLLKHAPNVPGCALAIEGVLREAGLPAGVFRSIFVDVEAVGEVIDHPLVRAVTLTGSVAAGKSVAARAGAAVKKSVLELGGSDPYIVLEDADLERAVETCVASRLTNSGQTCIAAKRLIVVKELREEFERRVVERMARARVGDPMDPETDIGPLARPDLREALHRQVTRSVGAGARCLLGGEIPSGPGNYYPPTVLSGVGPGMPAWDEELFGPVASIIEAEDEHDAIRIANETAFGLGAAVFTNDRERGERIARHELDAGACFVNQFVRSDPRLPFGGVKESGYGRELSTFGIREFVNVKTVWVE